MTRRASPFTPAALELDATAFADVQARVRNRVLRSFFGRGLIDKDDATEMRAWAHDGGFSVDGSVRIEAADRPQVAPIDAAVLDLTPGDTTATETQQADFDEHRGLAESG
mgnify:CR=1 FL=1